MNSFIKIFLSVVFVGFCSLMTLQAQEPPIIPLPNNYEATGSTFVLNRQTSIQIDQKEARDIERFIAYEVLKKTGISLQRNSSDTHSKIKLSLISDPSLDTEDAYRLQMDKDEIRIEAQNETGLFYGAISLLQMIISESANKEEISLPNYTITDFPQYPWRGFMLDESRHFFGKEEVKKILDEMAYLKLNRFHWHLTDEPGWRIEIKQYPLLTFIGGIGNYKNPLASAQYYSQEDIREIVAYAQERHIEVIPEIDMPGHATAANKAYPEYSGGGTEDHPDFTFNPGKEETYAYLTNILREIAVLFPSGKVHLGGDEVSFGIQSWNEKPEIKALMKKENLTDLKAVEHYFMRRMIDSTNTLFDQTIGWDELVDAAPPVENTLIYWWRHDQPQQLTKALNEGYQTVLMPRIPLYLDFVQDESHQQGRRWGGAFSPLQKIYDFSPTMYIEESDFKKHEDQILGFQGNLWTEQVASIRRLEYMIFPRITALAEAGWTSEKDRNYRNYLLRLEKTLKRYAKEDIYYFNPISKAKTPEVVD